MTNQKPYRFDNQTSLPYNGTQGFVAGSDTSEERAIEEATAGTATKRQRDVLRVLLNKPHGMTWSELGEELGLHHGQISGTLSVLHKAGELFQLVEKRKKSHPYVHSTFIDNFGQQEIIFAPSSTKAGKIKLAHDNLEFVVRSYLSSAEGFDCGTLYQALRKLDSARTG